MTLASAIGLGPQELKDVFSKSTFQSFSSTLAVRTDYSIIDPASFDVIADWEHYAILELMTIESFEPEYKWIAKSLKLSVPKVREAVQRLQQLGMLEIDKDGKWHDLTGGKTTSIPAKGIVIGTNAAFRRHQKQILEGAILALSEVKPNLRDQTSLTLAIDRSKLDEARQLTKRFRRDLAQLLCHTGKRTDVYHVGISLYPVSQIQ